MSKGRGMPRGMGGMNPGAMQKQLQELQQKMVDAQNALENETVTVTKQGGAITVVVNGHQKVMSIKIDPEFFKENADDAETFSDLLLAAVNEGIEASQKMASDRMGAITGGLGLPGM